MEVHAPTWLIATKWWWCIIPVYWIGKDKWKDKKLNNWSAHFHSDSYRPAVVVVVVVEQEEAEFYLLCYIQYLLFDGIPFQVPIVSC
jgi:hypothetical protein